MKNFIHPGEAIDIAAPAGGTVSGLVYVIGSLIGVAATTAAEGTECVLNTRGVYVLPKTGAQAWTQGAKIYWDGVNKVATTVSAGSALIGIAAAPATNPSATGWVKLGPTTV